MTAYTILTSTECPDYSGIGTLYHHTGSGAQVFHLANEDPENLFAFAFATLPEDSTGVAHILEHTVLCGSRGFPVKDPFLQLLKGSVHTFLNAMTYPDKTVYPAASPVREDFFNMLKVYGDAVFFPELRREMFRQEGHRLEVGADGSLERTGIVYNEMIGNYSSHDSVAGEYCYQSLLPDTIYRYDSGGNPRSIPDLTWEQFRQFHRRYYHPSNGRIILYGDIPAEESLQFLHEEFLRHFQAMDPAPVPERQVRWSAPRAFETTFPAEGVTDTGRRSSITMNWLLDPVEDQDRLLEAAVMAEVLVGHSGSPLTRALIDSGLGQDLSPVFGVEADLREAVFSVGLRGTDPEHRETIENLVYDTLRRCVEEGFDGAHVEGALRLVEFRNRELKSGPNGMRVMSRTLRTWMYGGNPADGLQFGGRVAALRRRYEENPRLIEEVVQRYLLENPHRSTVTVRPDTRQNERERQELQKHLEHVRESMDEGAIRELQEANEALHRLQEEPDDPEVLARIPALRPEDLPEKIRTFPGDREHLEDGTPVYRHPLATNGILYVDLAFDLPELSDRQELLLNLLGAAFTETGLPGLGFDQLQQELNLRTGGLSAYISNSVHYSDFAGIRRMFIVRLKVLDRVHHEGLELLLRILRDLDYSDGRRLGQVLEELTQDMMGALIPSGHSFASLRAARRLSGLAHREEIMNGITQFEMLRSAGESSSPAALGGELAQLLRRIINPQRLVVNLTGARETQEEVMRWLPELTGGLGGRTAPAAVEREKSPLPVWRCAPADVPSGEFLLTSANVSYVALALPGVSFHHPLAGAQDVLAHVLRTGLLWEKIRMRGGAYGAFASSKPAEGLFSFSSYRDPRTAGTLAAYREALEEHAATVLPQDAVDHARVSLLGRQLRPLTPREQGYTSFRWDLLGITDDLRQMSRDRLRAVTPELVRQAADTLLQRFSQGSVVVLGGASGLEEYRTAHGEVTVTALNV